MGKAGLYFNTIIRLSGKQVLYQCLRRLRSKLRGALGVKYSFAHYREGNVPELAAPVPKYESYADGVFTFLNRSCRFTGEWESKELGPLWSFNLNYMEYLLQPSMKVEEGKEWIFRFIDDEVANGVGMAPYCISLRFVNWVKFISFNYRVLSAEEKRDIDTSLYSQYRILDSNLEYNLAGNHLLENIFTLLWAAYYFQDKSIYSKAARMLEKELAEQTLPDGANYEQSPMYHCIILDRVLDAVNLIQNNSAFDGDDELLDFLKKKASLMLGWLQTICYSDGSYPLFNDSATGVAPTADALYDYASRLGVEWSPVEPGASGYHVANCGNFELRMDMGGIAASYIPGHSHADTFNFELRAGGKPYIVDTGISTYDVCERRFYERSTAAHNTVVVGGENSSRVWAAFRCAQRAEVFSLERGKNSISACHNGYRKLGAVHSRNFFWNPAAVKITDTLSNGATGKAYLHFAPGVEVSFFEGALRTPMGWVEFKNATNIELVSENVAETYNILKPCCCVEVTFTGTLVTLFSFN